MFKNYYSRRFKEIFGYSLQPSDALGDCVIQAKLAKCKLTLPKALIDYYSLAGQHYINEEHNQLLFIEQVNWMDDKLVFMQENQLVVYWGIDRADVSSPNPIVWQGINGDVIDWYEEKYRLNQFLMAMWRWTVTGLQEEPE
ncbi:MAG: hypothetical protein SAJ12_20370 [Jaaginema sp. PMC 1079.18]|nr:hypothetical protein [Jaaginema sp. PMC 1080.18]MEC4853343.1 hypothetical protein [Jaaginema sp. PMC 1079.18]MEC4868333.1 hypothetical protein [Jaaginema sp. PMC 1078.18]